MGCLHDGGDGKNVGESPNINEKELLSKLEDTMNRLVQLGEYSEMAMKFGEVLAKGPRYLCISYSLHPKNCFLSLKTLCTSLYWVLIIKLSS